MTSGPRTSRRGIAVIMALLMGVFVIVMALVLVAWVQNDNDFAARTALEQRAYDLAQSGLDFYRVHQNLVSPSYTVVVDPTSGDNFVVSLNGVGSPGPPPTGPDVVSQGNVVRGTKTYTRTLVVPGGQFPNIIDTGAQ